MDKTVVWCNMMYISFYIVLALYGYSSITGNTDMQNSSFQALVILGLINILNRR